MSKKTTVRERLVVSPGKYELDVIPDTKKRSEKNTNTDVEYRKTFSPSMHNVTFSHSNTEIDPSGSITYQSSDTTATDRLDDKQSTCTESENDISNIKIEISKSNTSIDNVSLQMEIDSKRTSGSCITEPSRTHIDRRYVRTTQKKKSTDTVEALWGLFRSLLALLILVSFAFFAFTPGPAMLSFHILFMALGWIYLMTFALNVYSPKHFILQVIDIEDKRKKHWILQTACITCALIGIAAAYIHKHDNSSNHLDSMHSILGFISFLLGVINAIGGLLTYKIVRRRTAMTFIIILCHTIIGLITFILGVISILSMFFDIWWDGGNVTTYVYIGLMCTHMIITIFRPLVKLYYRIGAQNHDNNLN